MGIMKMKGHKEANRSFANSGDVSKQKKKRHKEAEEILRKLSECKETERT